jgi:gamma-glutamyl hydrolase
MAGLNWFFAVSCIAFVSGVNDRPTIAVLATPGEENYGWIEDPEWITGLTGKGLVVGSYVKYLESAGLRVIPIHYASSPEEVRRVFSMTNGVLFTGGTAMFQTPDGQMSPYYKTARLLLDLTIEANDKGIYTPLYGICLGLEYLHNLVARADVLGLHEARWV